MALRTTSVARTEGCQLMTEDNASKNLSRRRYYSHKNLVTSCCSITMLLVALYAIDGCKDSSTEPYRRPQFSDYFYHDYTKVSNAEPRIRNLPDTLLGGSLRFRNVFFRLRQDSTYSIRFDMCIFFTTTDRTDSLCYSVADTGRYILNYHGEVVDDFFHSFAGWDGTLDFISVKNSPRKSYFVLTHIFSQFNLYPIGSDFLYMLPDSNSIGFITWSQ